MSICQWPRPAWTAQGGRLAQIKAGTPSNLTSLQDLRYTYDAVGNVLKFDDYKAGGPQTQRFGYDALDRLITATVSGGTGGLYPAQSYQYSPTGNLTSKTGVGGYAYNAAAPGGGACQAGTRATKPHALDTAGSVSFDYDCNGNVTTRVVSGTTYTLGYSVENMLVSVSGGVSASFVYDGDGQRVKGTVAGVTTVYVGDHYEWTGSTATARRYYYAGGQRIAERVGDSTLYFLLGDHLGSTSITANSSGGLVAEVRYLPWGETRYLMGTTPTTFRYTGQRQESGLGGANGLYDYGARWLDPYVGRWVQPDTIAAGSNALTISPSDALSSQAFFAEDQTAAPRSPQEFNRYSLALNNPTTYTDPTGHTVPCPRCGQPNLIWTTVAGWLGLPSSVDISSRGWLNSLAAQISCGLLGGYCKVQDGVLQGSTNGDLLAAGVASLGTVGLNSPLLPHGFGSADDFQAFASALKSGLADAGYTDFSVAFQGSSVTGAKYTTGQPFDVGRLSDFDIALASPSLLARARDLGIALRSGGVRTGPLSPADLEKLGLAELRILLEHQAGRPVNFMIFDSLETVTAKGPSIVVP